MNFGKKHRYTHIHEYMYQLSHFALSNLKYGRITGSFDMQLGRKAVGEYPAMVANSKFRF